jgi:hypothetical protein
MPDLPLIQTEELERCEIPQKFPGHHIVTGFRAGHGWVLRPKHKGICDLAEARQVAEDMRAKDYTSIRIYQLPADE